MKKKSHENLFELILESPKFNIIIARSRYIQNTIRLIHKLFFFIMLIMKSNPKKYKTMFYSKNNETKAFVLKYYFQS